jgi:hypothetical protein
MNLNQLKTTTSAVLLGLVLIGTGLILPRGAQAQQVDLTVSPPVSYIRVEPGKTFRLAITIRQNGTIPLQVTPTIVDFVPDSLSGQPVLQDSTEFKFVTIENEPKSFDQPFPLKPGADDQVVLYFNIPEHARAQEYHLSLLLSAQPDADLTVNGGNQTTVSAVIASNIIVLVARSDQDLGELEVAELKVPLLVDSLSRINYSILAKNNGPTATKPYGKAIIRNFSDQVVSSFPFYPDVILAQSARPLRAATADPELVTNPDELRPTTFEYDPQFLLGPYRVEVTLDSQAGQSEPVTVTKVVWALPFSIILFILGIVSLIFILRFSGNILVAKSSKNP